MPHTLIIGSGAAGLSAAVQLHRLGMSDILIATESLAGGTSINTGSDKQTYYKMACGGGEPDSVRSVAETLFAGGSMHGDLALAEAAGSLRAFMNLVELGVPFPRDEYGQFVGYKTDHDPRQRGTSAGPYTSRDMCQALIAEVRRRNIPVQEGLFVKSLLTHDIPRVITPCTAEALPPQKQVFGATFFDTNDKIHTIHAENTIFAVGGPGGLYETSVYPKCHHGAIGVALAAGAVAQNLPESQFGMASVKFRWNVSGTYMQCIPRFLSTAADGVSEVREFLVGEGISPAEWNSLIFLKGYQWPFDSRKISASSRIDIRVYEETVRKNRRVFLDFRTDATDFCADALSEEAKTYLRNSGALALPSPLARLEKMNPAAIRFFADHGIDLAREPLEIAVCAQHNNGGLAADVHWESVNLKRFFPIGEVNGSHGVYRPGGAALNSGQVGAILAAEFIAQGALKTAAGNVAQRSDRIEPLNQSPLLSGHCAGASFPAAVFAERAIFQERMSRAGAFLRQKTEVERALAEARSQYEKLAGGTPAPPVMEEHRNVHLLTAQIVYLDAILFQIKTGVGSRGSAAILDENGDFLPENANFRNFVLESWVDASGETHHRWGKRREIPEPDSWFENVWRKFQK